MIITTQFTEKELRLVVQLLESEREQLGPEIHHTDSAPLRLELRRRQRTVHRVAERLLNELSDDAVSPIHARGSGKRS